MRTDGKKAFGKAFMHQHLLVDRDKIEKGAPFFGPNLIPVAVQIIAAVLLWQFFEWIIGDSIANGIDWLYCVAAVDC